MQTGRGRVQRAREGVEGGVSGRDRKKGGFTSFEERTKGDRAKRCNCFNLLEISC